MTRAVALVAYAAIMALLLLAPPAKASTLSKDQRRARQAILDVWPRRFERQAIAVAWCESRLYRWATNGQYLGVFQMGSWERRTFGHGSGTYAQARAALRYFRRTGSDWSPWACRWAASWGRS